MTHPNRLVLLRLALLISVAFRSGVGDAVGLGPLRLQSALGQPLRASVQLLGDDVRSLDASCIRSRLMAPDGFDLLKPEIELKRGKAGTEIAISSRATVEEPAVTLLLELTCAPMLHRDYQLLLDLSEGLPRVNANAPKDKVLTQARALGVAAARVDGADPTSAKERRKARRSKDLKVVPRVGATADALEKTPPTPDLVVLRRGAGKGAARNVLKLTQDEPGLGMRPAAGLRLSDSLAPPDTSAPPADRAGIEAAKLRFFAMLHDEDPVVTAQKQIRALQTLAQQQNAAPAAAMNAAGAAAAASAPAAAGSAPAAAAPATAPAPATATATAPAPAAAATAAASATLAPVATPARAAVAPPLMRRAPAWNKWLLASGILLLLVVGAIGLLTRMARRSAASRSTPWWVDKGSDGAREAELLEAARSASTNEKVVVAVAAPASEPSEERQERILRKYVKRFVGAEGVPGFSAGDQSTVARAEPTLDTASVALATIADAELDSPTSDPTSIPGIHRRPGLEESVELVSDVMQEAEFWKMLNEVQRAIDILESYCGSDVSGSPVPWLFLAELYEQAGESARYDALSERFRQQFNGRMMPLEGSSSGGKDSLEEFPHIMQQISELWTRPDVVEFLQELLINRRDDPRQGFALPVYREILMLMNVARERQPLAV